MLIAVPAGQGIAEELSENDTSRSDQEKAEFVLDSGTFRKLPSPRSMVEFYRNFETLGVGTYDLMEKYVYGTSGEGVDDAHWWTRTRRSLHRL